MSTKVKRAKRKTSGKRIVNPDLYLSKPVVQYTPRVFGFPDRIMTKLRYCDFGSMATGAGVVLQQFRWNSTFDPDLTSTGHQPMYRDTYAAIYNRYTVIRAYADIEFLNPSATIGLLCGAVTDDDSTLTSTVDTILEMNTGINDYLTPLGGSKSKCKFRMSWEALQSLGINPYEFQTPVASNPNDVSVLNLWAAPEDGSTSIACKWKIELIQEVLWTELQTPSQS